MRYVGSNPPVLKLGNVDAQRDWGFAGDYTEAMHLMLQQERPDDFVIATGECHSVREFAEEAFRLAGRTAAWEIDQSLFRPCEVQFLKGRADKAHRVLGWRPKVAFQELVRRMVEADGGLA